ncbi:MAG: hypothetical protein FGM54_01965 [Chitinophagaceae bacterium]|nr:hypothetical protein [Chitinophagaceae bacterium]
MELWYSIKYFFHRVYRLRLKQEKWSSLVWHDLKKMHAASKWDSGIHERTKTIQTPFSINSEMSVYYFYQVDGDYFNCRVKLLEDYDVSMSSEIFILASHVNNILRKGKVRVNPGQQIVEYVVQLPLLIPYLYFGEVNCEMIAHYNTSKDLIAAFQRLVFEGESPAIIIADLIKENESKKDSEKS